jgi:hypothetical protein
MPRGGPRPNTGPKKGAIYAPTVKKRLAEQVWRERVEAELDPIITAQLELAKGAIEMFAKLDGLWVRVTDPATMTQLLNQGTDFYRLEAKEPDGRMLINIMDRLSGKPTERVEHTGPRGEPIQINHHYAQSPAGT